MDNAEKFQKAVEAARRDTLAASASNSPKQRKWELVVKRRGVNGRKTPAVTRVKGAQGRLPVAAGGIRGRATRRHPLRRQRVLGIQAV